MMVARRTGEGQGSRVEGWVTGSPSRPAPACTVPSRSTGSEGSPPGEVSGRLARPVRRVRLGLAKLCPEGDAFVVINVLSAPVRIEYMLVCLWITPFV